MGIGIRESVVNNAPLVFHAAEAVPGSAVFLAGFSESRAGTEYDMGEAFPLLFGECGVPEGLGFGAPEDVFSETLQLLSPAAVQQFVVFPVGCGIFDGHCFGIFCKDN